LPLNSRLNLEHDFQISTGIFNPANTILSILFLIGLAFWAVLNIKKHKLLSFGILFFLVTNLVESTIIPLELVFEHRLYLPSLGLLISITIVIDKILSKHTRVNQDTYIIVGLFFIIICSLLSLTTSLRNHTWRNFNSIYEDMHTKSPDKLRVLSQYARTLYDSGFKNKAINILEFCIDNSIPTNEELAGCATNLMRIYQTDDQPDKAIEVFKKAYSKNLAEYNAASAGPLMTNLASALHSKGDLDLANEALVMALMMPNDDYQNNVIFSNLTIYRIEKTLRDFFPDKQKNQLTETEYSQLMDIVLTDQIKTLTSMRRYDEALREISNLKNLSPDIEEQKTKILQIITANNKHRNQYKAQSHTSNKSISYKATLLATDIIFKNYNTSFPLIDKIIEKQLVDYNSDIFLKYLQARSLFLQNKLELSESILEEIVLKNDDFAPAIDMLIKIKLHIDKTDEAIELCKRILDIYHGHENWRSYAFNIKNN